MNQTSFSHGNCSVHHMHILKYNGNN